MIAAGAKVRIHYTLAVDGKVVDSSSGREPLEYVHGRGQLVPGVEAGLAGAKPGEKRHLTVKPADGYGEAFAELLIKAPRSALSHLPGLELGSVVAGEGPQGRFRGVVCELNDSEATIDLNHPLAGKTLDFDVEVVSVDAPAAGA